MASEFCRRFEEYIKARGLINNGDHIVIGVSGGADSVCLLLLLCEIRDKYNLELKVAHLDHMIRGEDAEADARFVQDLCERLGVECVVAKEDVVALSDREGLGTEEAGRKARYAFMCDLAQKENAKIALAHHMNDSAETVLLNLARGTRLKGLRGILPEGRMQGCTLIRPLLFAQREEIERYLKEKGAAFCTDATNEETEYSRNYIRHKVLKPLSQINENTIRHIAGTAGYISKVERYLEKETEAAYKEAVEEDGQKLFIRTEQLMLCDELIAERVVYKAAAKVLEGAKDLGAVHVERVMHLASLPSGKSVPLIRGFSARKEYERIVLSKDEDTAPAVEEVVIEKARFEKEEVTIDAADGRHITMRVVSVDDANRATLTEKKQCTKAFDYDRIKNAVKLGTKALGDRISLKEGSKSLKKFFTDEKIPAHSRDKVLLVKDEDSIIWIVGYRISEAHKITGDTKKALVIEISGGAYEY